MFLCMSMHTFGEAKVLLFLSLALIRAIAALDNVAPLGSCRLTNTFTSSQHSLNVSGTISSSTLSSNTTFESDQSSSTLWPNSPSSNAAFYATLPRRHKLVGEAAPFASSASAPGASSPAFTISSSFGRPASPHAISGTPSGPEDTLAGAAASLSAASSVPPSIPNGVSFASLGSGAGFATGVFPPSSMPSPAVAAALFLTGGGVSAGVGARPTNATTPASITAAPTPISFVNGRPVFAANASLPPTFDSGVLSLAYRGGNCSMSPDGYNAKSCSCVNSILQWYHSYATATITTQKCQLSMIEGISSDAHFLGCSFSTFTELATPYVAGTECCNKCEIVASAVQLIYWPPKPSNAVKHRSTNNFTIAAAPTAAHVEEISGVVSNGFTFISPSVYVVYTGISAQASCVAFLNSQTQLGSSYTVTRAYAPEALSTARCVAPCGKGKGIAFSTNGSGPPGYFQGIFDGWKPINYAELFHPPPAAELLLRYRSCFSNTIGSDFASQLFVTPQLSFPADVTDIDPKWETWGGGTCTPISLGVINPPRALGSATALGLAQVTTATPDSPFLQAFPGGIASLRFDPAPTYGRKIPGDEAPAFKITAQLLASATSSPGIVSSQQTSNILADGPANSPASTQKLGLSKSAAMSPEYRLTASLDPNNESPAQMSQLYQALRPVISPQPQAASDAIPSPNSQPDLEPQLAPVASPLPNPQAQAAPASNPEVNPEIQPAPAANPQSNSGPQAVPPLANPAAQAVTLTPVQPITNAPVDINSPVKLAEGPTLPSVGGQPILQDTNSNLIVAGSTVNLGQETTVAGQFLSNGGSIVAVNSKTLALQPPQAPTPQPAPAIVAEGIPLPSIANQPILQDAKSNLIIAGSTLSPGTQTTVAGQIISNGASIVVVNGNLQALQPPTAPLPMPAPAVAAPTQPLSSIDGQPVLQDAKSNLIVSGSMVPPGIQTVVAAQTVSDGAINVVVDGSTQALVPPTVVAPPLGENQIVQVSNGGLQVGGQTIAPGSQITVSGHVVNYANPSQVIVDGTSLNLLPVSFSNPLVVGSQSINRAPNGGLVIGSSALAPGNQATVSGQVYSLDGSSSIVVGGSTYSLPPTNNAYLVQAQSTAAIGPITLSNGLVVTPAGTAFVPGASSALYLPNGALIRAGGPSAIVSGTTYSLLPSHKGLLVNGASTLALPLLGTIQVFAVAGHTFTAAPAGFTVAGSSVTAGGKAIYISDTLLFLDASSLLQVGSSTFNLGTTAVSPRQSVFSVAGQSFTAEPSGFLIGSTTITPGGSAVWLSGTPVSLAPGGTLAIDSSTVALPPQSVFQVAGQTFTAESTGFSIAGTSIAAGEAVTISGTPVSLGLSGSLVIGSSTIILPSQSVFQVAGQTFTAEPTGFSIAGTSITAGEAVTISGTPVSLGSSGSLIIGNSTIALPSETVFSVGGQTFTAEPNGFSVAGTSIVPGQAVTISGTPISLGSSGTLVIGSNTLSLPPQSVFTLDGQTFTAQPTGFVLDGSTILPGSGGVKVSGVDVSLGTNSVLHIGSQTLATLGPISTSVTVRNGAGGGGAIASTFVVAPSAPRTRQKGMATGKKGWSIGLFGVLGFGTGVLIYIL